MGRERRFRGMERVKVQITKRPVLEEDFAVSPGGRVNPMNGAPSAHLGRPIAPGPVWGAKRAWANRKADSAPERLGL